MYRRIEDFLADWAQETKVTVQLLGMLTAASLERRVHPGGRTLSDLAWHLSVALGEIGAEAGLPVMSPADESTVPTMAVGFLETYQQAANLLADKVKTQWSDDTLAERVKMYGEEMERGKVLTFIVLHQAHHRGQMTVLMRQSGLRVPAIYGPAKEDWVEMGVQPKW